ncbi:hypothetical protein [Ruegeria hyattellae]|uniref:hypothetical protein n=1 Tax=Ruegeria hyattellae TaxID=3233337 RepID=UPI00355BE3AF
MPFKEADIYQFPTVFGWNMLVEVPNFVRSKMLIVTMEDLWPKFSPTLPQDAKVYFVDSMERSRLENNLAVLPDIASIVGRGGGQAVDASKCFFLAAKPSTVSISNIPVG